MAAKNALREEFRFLSKIHHEHVVEVVDSIGLNDSAQTSASAVCFSMRGALRLADELFKVQQSESEVIRIFYQVISALHYLHNLNPKVVHGNFHPGQLFLTAENDVQVHGFTHVQQDGISCTDSIISHPSFLAPECRVWKDVPEVDDGTRPREADVWRGLNNTPAADIWSFGCVILRMLGVLTDFEASIKQPKPPVNCSSALWRRLQQCLSEDEKERPTAYILMRDKFFASQPAFDMNQYQPTDQHGTQFRVMVEDVEKTISNQSQHPRTPTWGLEESC